MKVTFEHINTFLSRCSSSLWAGVFYSLPFETKFQFWLQDLQSSPNFSSSKFVFAPFDASDSPVLILHPHKRNEEAISMMTHPGSAFDFWENNQLLDVDSTLESQYHLQFEKYISAIRSGSCVKAILSTVIKEKLPPELNIGEYVFKLRKEYPQAFVYVYSSPFAGTWVGATPETLLRWNQKEVSTMSLAGTKKSADSSFSFGEKEKTEQEIVTGYIADIFKNHFSVVNLKEREELLYGEMIHLLSRVTAEVDDTFTSDRFLDLALKLHPTPAVGGFPVQLSKRLIQSTETHPRLYYSGFLGIMDENSAELAVNLRCMSLANGYCYAFAGGGLTTDSNVQEEWAETRLKANALLKFI